MLIITSDIFVPMKKSNLWTSRSLLSYVRSQNGNGNLVVLNPGSVPDQSIMDGGDIVCIFEGTESSYQSFNPPSWVHQMDPGTIFVLLIQN